MNRSKDWSAILLVGLVGGVVAVCFSLVRWPVPTIHDEFSHLLVADTLLHGRLSNPTPPVWPAFQSEHIVVTPSYASKYPIGNGALFALGRLIAGVPQAGPWLGAFLASAAVVWMVRGVSTLRVSIWAGLMVALHPYLQSVWSQIFVNGWLAMASACMVVGASIRLGRSWNGPVAAVFACGAVGLALTRQMEGLVCIIFATSFFLKRFVSVSGKWWPEFFPRRISWFLSPGAAGVALLLAHHHAVTGSCWQMPYQLHEKQYAVAPFWIFQPPKSPAWLDADRELTSTLSNQTKSLVATNNISRDHVPQEIRGLHSGWAMDCYRDQTSIPGWLSGCWERLRASFEYFGLITILAMVGVFQIRKWKKVRLVSLAVFGLFGISTFVPWVFPHYYAPLVPWLIILSVVAIRYSPIRLEGTQTDPHRTKKQIMFCLLGLQFMLLSIKAWNMATHPVESWSHRRSAIERELEEQGGKHLVLVRYSPSHNEHDEWVYNRADFDSAPVLWARSWRSDFDQQLKEHYGGTRQIWVVEPDADVVEPKSFSPLAKPDESCSDLGQIESAR
ncbi:MAG: hypothetical protein ABL888_05285 [Pirellulaceae bacterium]